MKPNFHLALPCESIAKTSAFYQELLEATIGRQTDTWIDVNLYGNQLTFTESGSFNFQYRNYRLGTEILPSFHFGIIVLVDEWKRLYAKLFQSEEDVTTQAIFMEDKIGEHLSFFIKDPNGYMIEFKSFKNKNEVFLR